jgi:hypothetical protein
MRAQNFTQVINLMVALTFCTTDVGPGISLCCRMTSHRYKYSAQQRFYFSLTLKAAVQEDMRKDLTTLSPQAYNLFSSYHPHWTRCCLVTLTLSYYYTGYSVN